MKRFLIAFCSLFFASWVFVTINFGEEVNVDFIFVILYINFAVIFAFYELILFKLAGTLADLEIKGDTIFIAESLFGKARTSLHPKLFSRKLRSLQNTNTPHYIMTVSGDIFQYCGLHRRYTQWNSNIVANKDYYTFEDIDGRDHVLRFFEGEYGAK